MYEFGKNCLYFFGFSSGIPVADRQLTDPVVCSLEGVQRVDLLVQWGSNTEGAITVPSACLSSSTLPWTWVPSGSAQHMLCWEEIRGFWSLKSVLSRPRHPCTLHRHICSIIKPDWQRKRQENPSTAIARPPLVVWLRATSPIAHSQGNRQW